MYQLVNDTLEIISLQKRFQTMMEERLGNKRSCNFGHLGRNTIEDVYTNGNLWYYSELMRDKPRFWNAFGLAFDDHSSHDIAVEINIDKGYNPRISGLFSRSPKGNEIWLMHRGRIGGGRKGIGKTTFFKWLVEQGINRFVMVDEGRGKVKQVLWVTPLDETSILDKVTEFVQIVATFKEHAVNR